MNLIAATPFLPSPAVPYVRISLFIATRWKPLPPRHYCDTQAHRHYSHCSCPQRPFAKRGYVVHLHHRYYGLIRQSDKILRPTEMTHSAFARVWDFYFQAFPYLVARIRVGYSYLSEQTTPGTELSPDGNAALWAAHATACGFGRHP